MGNKLLYPGLPTLLAAASGALLLRRLGRRWGATDDEVHRPMPADELIPHPMVETTHAITIQAAAAEVWPWLVQTGMDRGGWYSDPEWWDGLVCVELPRRASTCCLRTTPKSTNSIRRGSDRPTGTSCTQE